LLCFKTFARGASVRWVSSQPREASRGSLACWWRLRSVLGPTLALGFVVGRLDIGPRANKSARSRAARLEYFVSRGEPQPCGLQESTRTQSEKQTLRLHTRRRARPEGQNMPRELFAPVGD
jgi:hypothetical protein